MADEHSKTCGRCRAIKSIAEFYRGGRAGYCIECEKQYKREHYQRNAERIKEKTREWSRRNPERKRETDRAYVLANLAAVTKRRAEYQRAHHAEQLARSRKSRSANIERYRARESAYRAANRAECNRRIAEWKRDHPEAIVAYAGKRRAAELRAIPIWADLSAIAAVYKDARAVPGIHVDHIVPLISEKVCGLHCVENLQLLPGSENSRKNNRWWPDMW